MKLSSINRHKRCNFNQRTQKWSMNCGQKIHNPGILCSVIYGQKNHINKCEFFVHEWRSMTSQNKNFSKNSEIKGRDLMRIFRPTTLPFRFGFLTTNDASLYFRVFGHIFFITWYLLIMISSDYTKWFINIAIQVQNA